MVDAVGENSGEFRERVRYPEIDAVSEMGLSRERMIVEDKIFVAVGKVIKESKSTLLWALQNLKGLKICIVYVHVPAKLIPMPMGGKFPVSRVGEEELKAFREKEKQEMLDILDAYLQIYAQFRVCAEKLHIEMDSTIEEGIVELITQQRIGKLVMGAASDRRYSRKLIEPKSKKANYVRHHAPDYCHIWFVCKNYLIYTRKGVKHPSLDIGRTPSNSSVNNLSDVRSLSQELVTRLTLDFGVSDESSDEFGQSRSQSSPCLIEAGSAFSSSPPSVLETSMNATVYDQLLHTMMEAEKLRREAFEESVRRRQAEKEALEAIHKVKTAEALYYEELRLRPVIEEELARGEEELEFSKNLWRKVSQELQETMDLNLSLENEIEEVSHSVKELEQTKFSEVKLLLKYKKDLDELQIERNHALHEAENLRQQAQGSSISHAPDYFSEFSFSDLEKATNHFDPSLKIGEGGYGSIYKGLINQTEVAIKMLNPNSTQGPKEFDQEVDALSRLRHPNMVTLIGACPESWALVYEYLSGGSLEDRLVCKDNSPPLPWQIRIQIASELCSVLVFLHSSRPSCIIHGDLKPSNVLLDGNLVCKLSDFGICRVVSSCNSSMEEQPTGVFTTEPKGTFTYMDPEFLSTGQLTPKSDVYSFGVLLLRLLTGKPALRISLEVKYAFDNGNLESILDPSAGDWPFVQTEHLARMALKCCDLNGDNRPDLESVCGILEAMLTSRQHFPKLRLGSEDQAPGYFMCPIFKEIMEDPHTAADGFTYEAEAIKGWIDSGHVISPNTKVELANHNLIPNHALRSAIQEWLQNSRSR